MFYQILCYKKRCEMFPYSIYLNNPGTYDMNVLYCGTPSKFVTKENIIVSGLTNVNLSSSDAKNQVTTVGTDINTNLINVSNSYITFGKGGYDNFFGWIYGLPGNTKYLSDVGSSYTITSISLPPNSRADNLYMFGDKKVGLSGNWNITNTISDLKKVEVQKGTSRLRKYPRH